MNSTKITTKINKSLQNKNITSKKMNKLLKYYTKMTDEQQEKFDYLREDQFMHCSSCNIIFRYDDDIYLMNFTNNKFEDPKIWDKCSECRE